MNGEWHKSSRSGTNGGSCVEVRLLDGVVQVRDSKDPDGGVLNFAPDEWQAFVNGARDGEFGPTN